MQAPSWTDFLQCSVCTNKYDATQVVPISLSCGHTLCVKCLAKLNTRMCPYDRTSINPDMESMPPNTALLNLLGHHLEQEFDLSHLGLLEADIEQYKVVIGALEELGLFLQPLAEQGISSAVSHLTRPMLKKLVTIINCQVLEVEGRSRALRAARSISDRAVTELLVLHQNQQQISTLLWTAVRNRGCQFLGPVMQEEALKLILKVLESGTFMSRKTIVLYVVQQLQHDFPQASKTCVGHVVQLLYRASCFNVNKQEDDSSLMQLKEDFRSYESLRREHDGQIIRVAMEAGLRISPEQWSTLLYGDHKHKSDMQSIIDKLIAQGAASSGLSELIVAIRRSQDPHNLSEQLVPHLEVLLNIDINVDKSSEVVTSWHPFAEVVKSLLAVLQGFTIYMQIQSGRYKTGMCPNLTKPGGCPKGDKCTYAHTEDERERFRSLVRGRKSSRSQTDMPPKPVTMPLACGMTPTIAVRGGRLSGDLGPAKLDQSPFSSLNSYDGTLYTGSRDAFDSPMFPSYSMPVLSHLTVPPDPVQVYPPGAPFVGYPTHHHSGPITIAEGSLPRQLDIYYGGPHNYSGNQSRPNYGKPLHDSTDVMTHTEGSAQYHHSFEGAISYPNEIYSSSRTVPVSSGIASSLADVESIRRKHESLKKSLESSATRTEPPVVNGREEVLEYGTPTPLSVIPDGPPATTYPPSSLAEVQDGRPQAKAGGIAHPPPPSQSPFPVVSNPEVYYSVASQSSVRQEIRGGGSYGGYENDIQNSMAHLMVTSGVPSRNGTTTSSQAYDSSYPVPSTASGGKLHAPHDYSKPAEPQPSHSFPTSGETNTMVSSGYSAVQSAGSRNQEDTLREEIRKLQQQLQEKNATIAGLTSPSHTANLGSASTSSHHRHSGPIQHHTYSGPIQVPVPVHHYSPQNTMQQYSYYPTVPTPGTSYYPTAHTQGTSYYAHPQQQSPATSFPSANWSGPLSGSFSPNPSYSSLHGTPPGTQFIGPPGQYMVQDKDFMLATYLQASEQAKAAAQSAYNYSALAYHRSSDHYLPRAQAYAVDTTPHAARQFVYHPY